MSKSHRLAYTSLTLTSLFLACNHVIGRFAYTHIPPIGLSFWRCFLAGLILLPVIFYKKKTLKQIFQNNRITFLFLGILMIGPSTLVLVALNFSMAINVSIINSTQPILTIIFLRLFKKNYT